jgi:hypothetical protein
MHRNSPRSYPAAVRRPTVGSANGLLTDCPPMPKTGWDRRGRFSEKVLEEWAFRDEADGPAAPATDLKTGSPQGLGGSNPSPSVLSFQQLRARRRVDAAAK